VKLEYKVAWQERQKHVEFVLELLEQLYLLTSISVCSLSEMTTWSDISLFCSPATDTVFTFVKAAAAGIIIQPVCCVVMKGELNWI